MRNVVVVVVGGIVLVLLVVKEVLDLASTIDFVEQMYPRLVRWAERKAWQRVLLLITTIMYAGILYEMWAGPAVNMGIPSADLGTVKAKDTEIEKLEGQIRQLTAKQGGHWTREGIKSGYLKQEADRETQYSTLLTYTGSTTFNPIKMKITFN